MCVCVCVCVCHALSLIIWTLYMFVHMYNVRIEQCYCCAYTILCSILWSLSLPPLPPSSLSLSLLSDTLPVSFTLPLCFNKAKLELLQGSPCLGKWVGGRVGEWVGKRKEGRKGWWPSDSTVLPFSLPQPMPCSTLAVWPSCIHICTSCFG